MWKGAREQLINTSKRCSALSGNIVRFAVTFPPPREAKERRETHRQVALEGRQRVFEEHCMARNPIRRYFSISMKALVEDQTTGGRWTCGQHISIVVQGAQTPMQAGVGEHMEQAERAGLAVRHNHNTLGSWRKSLSLSWPHPLAEIHCIHRKANCRAKKETETAGDTGSLVNTDAMQV
jgi:hypothetical protein